MAKKIRFPLEMRDNVQVRTLEELQENFSLEKVLFYLDNGKLLIWLRDRYFDEIADEISKLNLEDTELNRKLCEIFDVEYDVSLEIDMELAAERNRKFNLLKEFGYEKEDYQEVIDLIAFEQDEIYDLLDEDRTTIYICGEKFSIPLGKKGIHYIGINNPIIVISSKEKVNFEEKGIILENIRFDEKYQDILVQHEKQEQKAQKAFGEYVEDTFTKQFMSKDDIESAKVTYEMLAKELEELDYDDSADTRDIMEYLLSTGLEDWGTEYLERA